MKVSLVRIQDRPGYRFDGVLTARTPAGAVERPISNSDFLDLQGWVSPAALPARWRFEGDLSISTLGTPEVGFSWGKPQRAGWRAAAGKDRERGWYGAVGVSWAR